MEWINPQADKDGPVQKPQYDDYRKMICHLAGNYARTYGNGYDMPFDKLISEGYLVFTRCAGKWNGKTTFSTYLYSCLQGRYKDRNWLTGIQFCQRRCNRSFGGPIGVKDRAPRAMPARQVMNC
ncbi:hypothetical protein LCGC14_0845480 [marine sediment metagenome]|uniref:Uncharacterized protein n=1 Tax=marine sediment metagenome TaxID=412755 RepID=A0A0F9PX41_9ZZZZ